MKIRELYKYSWFADLAYIRWRSESVGEAASVDNRITDANAHPKIPGNARKPAIDSLGEKIFQTVENGGEGWWVADFADNNSSGFSASLFVQEGGFEKVLAITGTEDTDLIRDLAHADLTQIGGLGLALDQAVSLFNYVQLLKWKENANVLQLDVLTSGEKPIGVTDYVQVEDGYIWFSSRYDGVGKGLLIEGDNVRITGHSLGGHLAAFGARLFPNLFFEAITFNAPGFDADLGVEGLFFAESVIEPLLQRNIIDGLLNGIGLSIVDLVKDGQKLTDSVYNNLFLPRLDTAFPTTFEQLAANHRILSFVAEDQSPGNDLEVVAGDLTGISPSTRIPIVPESNSHSMSQIVDALGVQALLEQLNPDLGLTGMDALISAASNEGPDSQEIIINALSQLLLSQLPLEGPISDLVTDSEGVQPFVDLPESFPFRGQVHER